MGERRGAGTSKRSYRLLARTGGASTGRIVGVPVRCLRRQKQATTLAAALLVASVIVVGCSSGKHFSSAQFYRQCTSITAVSGTLTVERGAVSDVTAANGKSSGREVYATHTLSSRDLLNRLLTSGCAAAALNAEPGGSVSCPSAEYLVNVIRIMGASTAKKATLAYAPTGCPSLTATAPDGHQATSSEYSKAQAAFRPFVAAMMEAGGVQK